MLSAGVLVHTMLHKDETLACFIVRALQDYNSAIAQWVPLAIITRRLALTDIGAIEAALTFGRHHRWIEERTVSVRCVQLTDVGRQLP